MNETSKAAADTACPGGPGADGWRQTLENLDWRPEYWIVAGVFAAMAFILVLPTGAASASILLTFSICFLLRNGSACSIAACLTIHERWFLASMTLYPISVLINILVHPNSAAWRHFDTPARFLLALPVYWAIRQSRVPPLSLIAGSIVGAAGAGILAIVQWSIHDVSRPGGFANPIPFADIALLLVVAAATPVRLPRIWRVLRPVGLVLGTAAVILAQTRGAWLAIPFLAILALQWYPGRWSSVAKLGLTAVLIGGLLAVVALVASNRLGIVLESLHNLTPEMRIGSLVARVETWSVAWTLFGEHPWTGVGIGQYGNEARALLETAELSANQIKSASTHAHNDFLHLGATMGVLGVSAYLIPLVVVFLTGRHLSGQGCPTMGVLLQAFAVGQCIFSLTQTQLSHNVSATFFGVMATAIVALGINDHQHKLESADRRSAEPVPTPSRYPP